MAMPVECITAALGYWLIEDMKGGFPKSLDALRGICKLNYYSTSTSNIDEKFI